MEGFLNPSEVLKKIKLKDNMTAADFGCGSGGWAIPLAKKLEDGKVYALDILEEPLSALKVKINLNKISNIKTVLTDVEKGTEIFEQSCDLVLMTNLLFQVEDKKKVFEEAKRILKKNGRILVVDWQEESSLGPEEKVSSEEVKKIAEEAGFNTEKEFEAGTHHYTLIFVKN